MCYFIITVVIKRLRRPNRQLSKGAIYSILGLILLSDSFGFHIPAWLSPAATFGIVGYFFWKSLQKIR